MWLPCYLINDLNKVFDICLFHIYKSHDFTFFFFNHSYHRDTHREECHRHACLQRRGKKFDQWGCLGLTGPQMLHVAKQNKNSLLLFFSFRAKCWPFILSLEIKTKRCFDKFLKKSPVHSLFHLYTNICLFMCHWYPTASQNHTWSGPNGTKRMEAWAADGPYLAKSDVVRRHRTDGEKPIWEKYQKAGWQMCHNNEQAEEQKDRG
jgi:hypothetical protein